MSNIDFETITFVVTDGVATITLNRPDVMNAMNAQMRADITAAVKRASSEARVVVITGAGKAFCSGQDLGGSAAGGLDVERVLRDEYEPMIHAMIDCPLPVIAAVNGPAAGAGANMALAADVVIATQSAYFMQAFARIGLIPDAGGTWVMPRSMGLAKAMGASLFADKISADDAAQMGLIWESIVDDDFSAQVAARAAHLASGPTEAYARIKKSLRASFENNLTDQLAVEATLQGEAGRTRDFKEGVSAFVEKRSAKFEGR